MIVRVNGSIIDFIQQVMEHADVLPTQETLRIAADIATQHPNVSLFQAVEAAKLLEILHHAYSLSG